MCEKKNEGYLLSGLNSWNKERIGFKKDIRKLSLLSSARFLSDSPFFLFLAGEPRLRGTLRQRRYLQAALPVSV